METTNEMEVPIDKILDDKFYENIMKSDPVIIKTVLDHLLKFIEHENDILDALEASQRDLINERNKVVLMYNRIKKGVDDGQ